jgi:hypothetical protein
MTDGRPVRGIAGPTATNSYQTRRMRSLKRAMKGLDVVADVSYGRTGYNPKEPPAIMRPGHVTPPT